MLKCHEAFYSELQRHLLNNVLTFLFHTRTVAVSTRKHIDVMHYSMNLEVKLCFQQKYDELFVFPWGLGRTFHAQFYLFEKLIVSVTPDVYL